MVTVAVAIQTLLANAVDLTQHLTFAEAPAQIQWINFRISS